MDLTLEQIRQFVDSLDRTQQLDLAQWILQKEERQFDLTETTEDLASIRRGLEQVDRRETRSTEEVMTYLKKLRDQ